MPRRNHTVAVIAALITWTITVQPVAAQDREVGIEVLSSRADLVSGGDALVALTLPPGQGLAGVVVDVDGRDVTASFRTLPDGRHAALLSSLSLGEHVITASLAGGGGAQLTVTNHSRVGPLFSGPHLQPYLCGTVAAGLGEPTDEDCSAPAQLRFVYKSAVTGQFHALDDPAARPPDVASTTTDEGETLDYIVRIERGVIDRAIYDIAVLYDPEQPDWSPWIEQRGWNGKLLWEFGGNGNPDHRQLLPPIVTDEGADTASPVRDPVALARGYAVAGTSLNILGQNVNTVRSAESLAMTKEHLAETYGVPRFTVGMGCSGGSINVHEIAEVYPGLLDGILPYCSFPDLWAPAMQLVDCALLERYWDETSPHLWPEQSQRGAVGGEVSPTVCSAWTEVFRFQYQLFEPSYGCVGARTLTGHDHGVVEQPEWTYDAATNPDGVRCTVQDYMANVYGRERPEGWAGRPYDNVGIEYGLEALNAGTISAEQFVDLNAQVGGYDIDFGWQPERTQADPQALVNAYRSGRVTHGSGGLSSTAILDFRTWSPAEVHTDYHSFSMRERLLRANGHADNHVIVRAVGAATYGLRPLFERVLDQMDRWMTNLEADTSGDPLAVRVVRARPDDLVDICYFDAGQGQLGETDASTCATAYPYGQSPRSAAEAPFTNDVLKCRLRPIDWSRYAVEFIPEQQARLLAAFPDGVCDWSQPGVGQQPPAGTWLTFAGGPGGESLGDPPVSAPFGPQGAPALVTRHGGAGRVETAVAVSGLGMDAAESVVIARADQYADALSGGPLAVQLDAPLLLSRSDRLSPATAEEIRRLGATGAVLLGGEAALSAQVAGDLQALGVAVRRIEGANRYATAAAIAGELPDRGEVLLARGDGFTDALSASGLGALNATPVLLAEPDRLPPQTADALTADRDVTIIGGTAAISEAVAQDVDAAAGNVSRLAGPTRYATSAVVADAAWGVASTVVWVATGSDFPDALVAGAAAGRDQGVLLLVDGSALEDSPQTREWLAAHASDVERVRIAGGTAAISPRVQDALEALL